MIAYLNDILIYSDNLDNHRKHILKGLEALSEAGLYLNSINKLSSTLGLLSPPVEQRWT
jgi:hypothetical protein